MQANGLNLVPVYRDHLAAQMCLLKANVHAVMNIIGFSP